MNVSMFLYSALKLHVHVSYCVNYDLACTYMYISDYYLACTYTCISDEHRVPRDVSAEGPFPYIVTHKEGQVRVPCKMSLSL